MVQKKLSGYVEEVENFSKKTPSLPMTRVGAGAVAIVLPRTKVFAETGCKKSDAAEA